MFKIINLYSLHRFPAILMRHFILDAILFWLIISYSAIYNMELFEKDFNFLSALRSMSALHDNTPGVDIHFWPFETVLCGESAVVSRKHGSSFYFTCFARLWTSVLTSRADDGSSRRWIFNYYLNHQWGFKTFGFGPLAIINLRKRLLIFVISRW